MRILLAVLLTGAVAVVAAGGPPRVLRTAGAGRVKTLDPVLADDLASRDVCGAVFDTLLAYDYTARPYRLKPSMLEEMPEISADFREYRFKLRSDLSFPEVGDIPAAPLTSRDVRFSLLRLADARNHSPLYWIVRGKISGIDDFHRATLDAREGDYSLYDRGISGIVIHGDREFTIRLTEPDPRFLYLLAMPNTGVVSRRAVERFGVDFARRPVGSGPFVLEKWIDDYKMVLRRNPSYRREFFTLAKTPADRKRPLPLCDRIEILQVRQPMTAWMMFLQGGVDINALDKDNFDLVVTADGRPVPALEARGIRLIRMPEFEIRYVGFNFSDPVLGGNLKLRQALSLAYDVAKRVRYAGGQLIPAQGPLPEGVAGFDPEYRNPYARCDLELAKRLLAEAGFPGGIDPSTGRKLTLTFDQTGNSTVYRQMGELAAADFAALGIEVVPVMNNKPRFFEKLRQGRLQLFRLSWIGDYPDAENFFQLFYSGNRQGCNRTGYSDRIFDEMYEKTAVMPDSPERVALFRRMTRYLGERCVWIFEGFPVSTQLCHAWLENYLPHDFPCDRWKYLAVDSELRSEMTRNFKPLSFSELSGGGR